MPEFSPSTLSCNVGELHAQGESASLLFDVRHLPSQSPQEVSARLEALVERARLERPGVEARLRCQRCNPALYTPLDSSIVTESLRIMADIGLPVRVAAKAGCTEAGLYAAAGMQAVVFGPGRAEDNIHAPNEWVSLSQLERCVDFYAAVIEALCCPDPFPGS